VATVLVPGTPSPALSVAAPALWVVRTPADLKRVHSDTPPAAYQGREFSRSERILMRIVVEGQRAATAAVSIGLIDRRGKRLTDLPFTRTPAGWLLDLPLQSIARGEYLIGVEAEAAGQRSTAYVPDQDPGSIGRHERSTGRHGRSTFKCQLPTAKGGHGATRGGLLLDS
jgi:hypothetical protein